MSRFAGEGEQYGVAPFVLVVDESGSMEAVIEAVSDWVPRLIATMRQIPEASESVALGIIGFNTSATVHRKLAPLDQATPRIEFGADDLTSYVAPLEAVYDMIEREVPRLASRGWRPVVFFVTDGNPNVGDESEWVAARERLLNDSFRLHPRLVPLGFGQTDPATLRRLASDPQLAEYSDADPAQALDEILEVVLRTIITLTNHETAAAPRRQDDRPGRLADRLRESERQTIAYAD